MRWSKSYCQAELFCSQVNETERVLESVKVEGFHDFDGFELIEGKDSL